MTGFDRRRTDLEDVWKFLQGKFGLIVDIQQPTDQFNKKQPFMFVTFQDSSSADHAVNEEVNFFGNKLQINYKIQKEEQSDKDCWFCFKNNIDRHLIFKETEHFYLALPKGGVNDFHFLVLPKEHIAN